MHGACRGPLVNCGTTSHNLGSYENRECPFCADGSLGNKEICGSEEHQTHSDLLVSTVR